MRIMRDSTAAADIPRDTHMVAGYVDGDYAWSDADWALFPDAVKVAIAVHASTNRGIVLDVERGDARPDEAPGWAQMRRTDGEDPSVYCSLAEWDTVRNEFVVQGIAEPHWWIAAYPGNGPNLYDGSVAHQWANEPMTGGHYDESVVADNWPGVDPPPPAPSPVPPVVITLEDFVLIKMQVQATLHGKVVSTDDQGWGSTIVPGVAPDRFVNAFPNGAGYVELPQFHSPQDENGELRINWRGAPLAPPFEAHIIVSAESPPVASS